MTIRGNKVLLRYFRNFNNASRNENTKFLEYQTYELKVPCLPQSMLLLAFHISHSLNAKGSAGSEKKHTQVSFKFLHSKCSNFDQSIRQ